MNSLFVIIFIFIDQAYSYFTCDELQVSYENNGCCTNDMGDRRFDIKPYGRGKIKERRFMTRSGTPYILLTHTDNEKRQTIFDFPGVGVELGQQAALYSVNNPETNPYYNYVQIDGDVSVREFHKNLNFPEVFCNDFPPSSEGEYRCTQHKALSGNVTRLNYDVIEIMDKLVSEGYAVENEFTLTGVSLGAMTGITSVLQSDIIMNRVKTVAIISGLWATRTLPDISMVNKLKDKNIYFTFNPKDSVIAPLVSLGMLYNFSETVGSITSALKCDSTPELSLVVEKKDKYNLTEHKYKCNNGTFEHLDFEIEQSYPAIPLGFVSTYNIPTTHFFTTPESAETVPLDYWDSSQIIYSTGRLWNFLNRVHFL